MLECSTMTGSLLFRQNTLYYFTDQTTFPFDRRSKTVVSLCKLLLRMTEVQLCYDRKNVPMYFINCDLLAVKQCTTSDGRKPHSRVEKHLMKRWLGASEPVNVRECFTCGCGTRWGGWWQSRGSSKPGGGCQKAGRVSECGAPTLQPDEVRRDDWMSRSVGGYAWLLLQGGLLEPIPAVMGRHGYNLDKSPINCSVGCATHCNTVSPKTLEMRHRWPWRYHLELLLNILEIILDCNEDFKDSRETFLKTSAIRQWENIACFGKN